MRLSIVARTVKNYCREPRQESEDSASAMAQKPSPSYSPVRTGARSTTRCIGCRIAHLSRDRLDRPAEEVDLLLAIFTVNKTAKRYRDAASRHYQRRQHGFAGDASSKKHSLYRLKDLGIMSAHQLGRLSFLATHGNLAVYRGEGYCFHSYLLPADALPLENEASQSSPVFIEATPKGGTEARLKDAKLTLTGLPNSEAGYRRLPPT